MTEHPLLNLWTEPAFEPRIAWMIYYEFDRETQKRDYYVRIVRRIHFKNWQKARQKIDAGEWMPDIISILPIDTYELEQRLKKLESISVPVAVNDAPMGYDGVTYGLEYFAPSHIGTTAQFTWWAHGPDGWQELVRWFNEMTHYLQDTDQE